MPYLHVLQSAWPMIWIISIIIASRTRRANPPKFDANFAILAAFYAFTLGSAVAAISVAIIVQDHLLIPGRQPNHVLRELAITSLCLLLGLTLSGLGIWIFVKRRTLIAWHSFGNTLPNLPLPRTPL
jgi:hypothetical protein